jgi:spermidine synthase
MNNVNQKFYNTVIYFLIGFTTIIAQVIFIREFMIAFYGNELTIGIILAFWLGWIAIGSISFNKLFRNVTDYTKLISIFLLFISILLPLTVYFIRIGRTIFTSVPGELPGILYIILTAAFILAPVCLIGGAFFALAAKSHSKDNAFATSIVYKYEAIGSAVGGLLLSFVLLDNLNSFQIMLFLSFINTFLAFTLLWSRLAKNVKLIVVFLCIAFVTISGHLGKELHLFTTLEYWQNYKFIESKDSVYGHVSVIEIDGAKSIYSNGMKVMSAGDATIAEELVHYVLLQHDNPQNILIIGSTHPDIFPEILKYKSVKKINYVDLDPVITEMSLKYFAESWDLNKTNERINLINQDGRFYINQSKDKFDVIILNVGDPLNANINRFYTIEFFEKIKSSLSPFGIFTFQLSSSENYLSKDLTKILKVVNNSLKKVFGDVKIIPGETIHFFASKENVVLSPDADVLIEQLNTREVVNQFVNEYYLHFKLLPERIQEVESQIEPDNSTITNHDFQPVAYFFNLVFWSSQFSPTYGSISEFISNISFSLFLTLIIVLLLLLFIIISIKRKKNAIQQNMKIAVFIMGLSLITTELIVLLGFQAIYGYIYNQMAALIGFFMAGIALGSGFFLKQKNKNTSTNLFRLTIVQIILGILPIIVFVIFKIESIILGQILIFLITFICGAIGGYHFPLVSKIYFSDSQNVGILYGLDILGAMIGTIIFGVICIPLYGFLNVAFMILILNTIVASSILILKINTK